MSRDLSAIFMIDKRSSASTLKRLALLFDRVYYTVPSFAVIMGPDGPLREIPSDFDPRTFKYFRDTKRIIRIGKQSLRNQELVETIDAFEEAGVLTESGIDDDLDPRDRQILEYARSSMVGLDVKDAEFNRLSGTDLQLYERCPINKVTLGPPGSVDPSRSVTLFCMDDPPSVADSLDITTTLFYAHRLSLFPIFTLPQHKAEMDYRYRQCQQGLAVLRDLRPNLVMPEDFKARFGEVAFGISNSVFSADAVLHRTPEEILAYRASMAESRRAYVSSDLMELSSLVEIP